SPPLRNELTRARGASAKVEISSATRFAARFGYPAKQRGISLFLVRGIQFPQKNQIPSGNPAAVLALRLRKQPDGPCCQRSKCTWGRRRAVRQRLVQFPLKIV